MRKSESLILLEGLGFNTLEHFITRDRKEAMEYLEKNMNSTNLLSLRTERGNDFQCPFFYKYSVRDLADQVSSLLEKGYTLIFSPSLDTSGGLAFGALALGDEGEDTIEIVLEKGLVRELDTHPNKRIINVPRGSLMAVSNQDFPGKAMLINQIYKEAKELIDDHSPCILEFSYYSYPVGRLNKNTIWWEIREYR